MAKNLKKITTENFSAEAGTTPREQGDIATPEELRQKYPYLTQESKSLVRLFCKQLLKKPGLAVHDINETLTLLESQPSAEVLRDPKTRTLFFFELQTAITTPDYLSLSDYTPLFQEAFGDFEVTPHDVVSALGEINNPYSSAVKRLRLIEIIRSLDLTPAFNSINPDKSSALIDEQMGMIASEKAFSENHRFLVAKNVFPLVTRHPSLIGQLIEFVSIGHYAESRDLNVLTTEARKIEYIASLLVLTFGSMGMHGELFQTVITETKRCIANLPNDHIKQKLKTRSIELAKNRGGHMDEFISQLFEVEPDPDSGIAEMKLEIHRSLQLLRNERVNIVDALKPIVDRAAESDSLIFKVTVRSLVISIRQNFINGLKDGTKKTLGDSQRNTIAFYDRMLERLPIDSELGGLLLLQANSDFDKSLQTMNNSQLSQEKAATLEVVPLLPWEDTDSIEELVALGDRSVLGYALPQCFAIGVLRAPRISGDQSVRDVYARLLRSKKFEVYTNAWNTLGSYLIDPASLLKTGEKSEAIPIDLVTYYARNLGHVADSDVMILHTKRLLDSTVLQPAHGLTVLKEILQGIEETQEPRKIELFSKFVMSQAKKLNIEQKQLRDLTSRIEKAKTEFGYVVAPDGYLTDSQAEVAKEIDLNIYRGRALTQQDLLQASNQARAEVGQLWREVIIQDEFAAFPEEFTGRSRDAYERTWKDFEIGRDATSALLRRAHSDQADFKHQGYTFDYLWETTIGTELAKQTGDRIAQTKADTNAQVFEEEASIPTEKRFFKYDPYFVSGRYPAYMGERLKTVVIFSDSDRYINKNATNDALSHEFARLNEFLKNLDPMHRQTRTIIASLGRALQTVSKIPLGKHTYTELSKKIGTYDTHYSEWFENGYREEGTLESPTSSDYIGRERMFAERLFTKFASLSHEQAKEGFETGEFLFTEALLKNSPSNADVVRRVIGFWCPQIDMLSKKAKWLPGLAYKYMVKAMPRDMLDVLCTALAKVDDKYTWRTQLGLEIARQYPFTNLEDFHSYIAHFELADSERYYQEVIGEGLITNQPLTLTDENSAYTYQSAFLLSTQSKNPNVKLRSWRFLFNTLSQVGDIRRNPRERDRFANFSSAMAQFSRFYVQAVATLDDAGVMLNFAHRAINEKICEVDQLLPAYEKFYTQRDITSLRSIEGLYAYNANQPGESQKVYKKTVGQLRRWIAELENTEVPDDARASAETSPDNTPDEHIPEDQTTNEEQHERELQERFDSLTREAENLVYDHCGSQSNPTEHKSFRISDVLLELASTHGELDEEETKKLTAHIRAFTKTLRHEVVLMGVREKLALLKSEGGALSEILRKQERTELKVKLAQGNMFEALGCTLLSLQFYFKDVDQFIPQFGDIPAERYPDSVVTVWDKTRNQKTSYVVEFKKGRNIKDIFATIEKYLEHVQLNRDNNGNGELTPLEIYCARLDPDVREAAMQPEELHPDFIGPTNTKPIYLPDGKIVYIKHEKGFLAIDAQYSDEVSDGYLPMLVQAEENALVLHQDMVYLRQLPGHIADTVQPNNVGEHQLHIPIAHLRDSTLLIDRTLKSLTHQFLMSPVGAAVNTTGEAQRQYQLEKQKLGRIAQNLEALRRACTSNSQSLTEAGLKNAELVLTNLIHTLGSFNPDYTGAFNSTPELTQKYSKLEPQKNRYDFKFLLTALDNSLALAANEVTRPSNGNLLERIAKEGRAIGLSALPQNPLAGRHFDSTPSGEKAFLPNVFGNGESDDELDNPFYIDPDVRARIEREARSYLKRLEAKQNFSLGNIKYQNFVIDAVYELIKEGYQFGAYRLEQNETGEMIKIPQSEKEYRARASFEFEVIWDKIQSMPVFPELVKYFKTAIIANNGIPETDDLTTMATDLARLKVRESMENSAGAEKYPKFVSESIKADPNNGLPKLQYYSFSPQFLEKLNLNLQKLGIEI